jgi:hypothetical protein
VRRDPGFVLMRHGVRAAGDRCDPAASGLVRRGHVRGRLDDPQWHAAYPRLGRGLRDRPRSSFGAIGAHYHFRRIGGLVLVAHGCLPGSGTSMLPSHLSSRQRPSTPSVPDLSRDRASVDVPLARP